MQIGTRWEGSNVVAFVTCIAKALLAGELLPKSVISASAIMSSSSLGGGGAIVVGRLLVTNEFVVGCGKRNASKASSGQPKKGIAQVD